MEERCGCRFLVQRSFLDLRISAGISDTGRPRRSSRAGEVSKASEDHAIEHVGNFVDLEPC